MIIDLRITQLPPSYHTKLSFFRRRLASTSTTVLMFIFGQCSNRVPSNVQVLRRRSVQFENALNHGRWTVQYVLCASLWHSSLLNLHHSAFNQHFLGCAMATANSHYMVYLKQLMYRQKFDTSVGAVHRRT